MKKRNDNTKILLLLAAGLGVYWLIKKSKKTEQISTQPVIEQPITETPKNI